MDRLWQWEQCFVKLPSGYCSVKLYSFQKKTRLLGWCGTVSTNCSSGQDSSSVHYRGNSCTVQSETPLQTTKTSKMSPASVVHCEHPQTGWEKPFWGESIAEEVSWTLLAVYNCRRKATTCWSMERKVLEEEDHRRVCPPCGREACSTQLHKVYWKHNSSRWY